MAGNEVGVGGGPLNAVFRGDLRVSGRGLCAGGFGGLGVLGGWV